MSRAPWGGTAVVPLLFFFALMVSLVAAAAHSDTPATPPGNSTLGASSTAENIKVLNDDAHYPEGPLWHGEKLYYVEYDRNTITTWDGRSNSVFASMKGCGPSAVVATVGRELLVTCYDDNTIGRLTRDGAPLKPYTMDNEGHTFMGPNDFAPDAHGGIYFTASGDHSKSPVTDGKVYYISPDSSISLLAANVRNANGIAVSKDGRILYVVETDANDLLAFDIGPNGSLSRRRVFVNLDDLTGHVVHVWPDGVKIDARGKIYIGQSAREEHVPLAGTIFVVDARAKLLRTIVLPSLQVPNFAFGADEKNLYVTAVDQIDKPPYRGKVYAVPLH